MLNNYNKEVLGVQNAFEIENVQAKEVARVQEALRQTAGVNRANFSPFGFTVPSLYSDEILKNDEVYSMNFDGSTDGTNPVAVNAYHLLGGSFELRTYVAQQIKSIYPTAVEGYGGLAINTPGIVLSNLEVFVGLAQYYQAGSLRTKIAVTGSEDTPIVAALAFEVKGSIGVVRKNIPTYFPQDAQNTKTQFLQENQILSLDRVVVLITKPAQETIQVMSISK